MITKWAGTMEGFDNLMGLFKANQKLLEVVGERRAMSDDDDDDELEAVETVQVVGTTGIVSFRGGMTTEESWFSRLLGIPSYAGIKAAVSELASNPEVKDIVLHMDTPGGPVDGLRALSKFVRAVSKGVKPVYAHTAGSMCSAGYYLSAGCHKVYADEGARIGSIGVLAVTTEFTEMLKNAGITKHVHRSAPYKALNNPFEKQSDKAREEIEDELKAEHTKFVNTIAEGRALEASWVSQNIASGKVFDEVKAAELKMIDGVLGVEQLVGKLNAKRSQASSTPASRFNVQNPRVASEVAMKTTGRKGPIALPSEVLATLAMGGSLPEITAHEIHGAEALEAAEGEEQIEAVAAAAEQEGAAATAEEVASAAEAVQAGPAPANSEVVALLQTQLSAAQTSLAQVQVELAVATRELASSQIAQTALEAPVRTAIQRLSIALGATVIGLDSAKGTTLVEQFNSLNEKFEKRFVVGQQTRSDAESANNLSGSAANVSPINRRMVAATGLR